MQDNGGDRDVPDGDAPSGREEAAGVTGLYWRGRCAREPERGRPRPGMAKQSHTKQDIGRGGTKNGAQNWLRSCDRCGARVIGRGKLGE